MDGVASNILCEIDNDAFFSSSVETVERKSIGHPDTLADMIAEQCSYSYSKYCLDEFGAIPNHWVDKVVIQGGRASMSFGRGEIVSPIIVRIFGKTTNSVGSREIPCADLFRQAARYVITKALHVADFEQMFQVETHTADARGTGRPNSWYQPESVADIVPPAESRSNDASICCGFWPPSPLQQAVLDLDFFIHMRLRKQLPVIGTDIKLLARRVGKRVSLEACIPFLAAGTPDFDFYSHHKEWLRTSVKDFLEEKFEGKREIAVSLNTRDDRDNQYMLVTGSAADTGDCGVVGRGNRSNGLITPMHPMSLEAPAGKNPVNHAGRLYQIFAGELSRQVQEAGASAVQCFITSATGDRIGQPRSILLRVAEPRVSQHAIEQQSAALLKDLSVFVGNVKAQREWFNKGYQFGGFDADI